MPISSLRITDFRNLVAIDLALHSRGINVFDGKNGSGKTSLLEAVYYLGLGRSFRSNIATHLIRHNTKKFTVVAHIHDELSHPIPLGFEKNLNGKARMRFAERELTSIAEMAHQLPVRLINAQSHQLFEGSPLFRRKFLDWGLFYQFPNFLTVWRNFEHILKQRNTLLREKRPIMEINGWTNELAKYGMLLDQLRRDYVCLLSPFSMQAAAELLGIGQLEITYQSGWDVTVDYATVLTENLHADYRLGHTQYGPHRADLLMTFDKISARHFLSRGQQKLLICAMMLAQGLLLKSSLNKELIYLIDDLPSELDQHSCSKLLASLIAQQNQVFVTAIDRNDIYQCLNGNREILKVFHVEQGCVMEQVGV